MTNLDALQEAIDAKTAECLELEAKALELRTQLQALIAESDELHYQEQHRMMDVVVP